jgi:hypothetical protein
MSRKVALLILPTLLLLASASLAQTGQESDQVLSSPGWDSRGYAPQDYLASGWGVHGWQGDVFSYYNYQGKTYRPYRYYSYPSGVWYPYYYRYGYYPYSYRYYWYPYSYNGGYWWSW